MNFPHLHLLINHIPVLGAAFGLALLAWAMIRKSDELVKVSLGVFVLVGLAGIAVYFTGDPAAHAIRNLPGVTKEFTEDHEEAALVATIAAAVLGAIAAIVLRVFRGRPVSRGAAGLTFVGGLIVAGLMAWTAFLGGRVRHTEIRPGFVMPDTAPGVRNLPTP